MRRSGSAFTTDFSEFTFGYALTRSVEQRLPMVSAVPSFPSLQEEGNVGGYDVCIERPKAPLYLQFKIPRVMCRPNKKTPEIGLLTTPYYRMYIHCRDSSDQQRLLLDLANTEKEVYYATPDFDDKATIDSRHQALTVADATSFFAPGDIGPLEDDEEHYVAYTAGDASAWFCSDPKKVSMHRFEHLAGFVDRSMRLSSDSSLYERLIKEYRYIVAQQGRSDLLALIDAPNPVEGPLSSAFRASYLAQVVFDCQLMVVHDPRPNEG